MKKKWDLVFRNLYVTFGIIAIVIFIIAYLLPAQNNSSELYAFVSGSLVTIFAVVLSLSFIFIEISTKPSRAMDKLLNNKNLKLIYFFFFIGIIFHLFVTKTDYNALKIFGIDNFTLVNFNMSVSVAILTYGFLLIVPFAREIIMIIKFDRFMLLSQQIKNDEIKSKIEIEEGIKELLYLEEGLRETDYIFYHTYVLPELRDAGIKSAEKGCINSKELILNQLKDIGMELIELNSDKLKRYFKKLKHKIANLMRKNQNFDDYYLREDDVINIINFIKQIEVLSIEKKLMISQNLPAAFDVVDELGKIGVKAVTKKMPYLIVEASQYGLLQIGMKSANNQINLQFQQKISQRLIEIYEVTTDNNIRENSMKCLWFLSASIHLHLQGIDRGWIIEINNELKNDPMRTFFKNTYPEAEKLSKGYSDEYPGIEDALKKFKENFERDAT